MEIEREILEYLKECNVNEYDAISARELAQLFNITGRELRKIVSRLRVKGNPICSSNMGYWYSYGEHDIRKTVARLQAQIDELQKVVTGLSKGLTGGNE